MKNQLRVFGTYFTGKSVNCVIAAVAVKVFQAMKVNVRNKKELPKEIVDLAKSVLEGKKERVWKTTICLPDCFSLQFPHAEVDDEKDVEGDFSLLRKNIFKLKVKYVIDCFL